MAEHPTIVTTSQRRICRTLLKYMLEIARLVCDQKSLSNVEGLKRARLAAIRQRRVYGNVPAINVPAVCLVMLAQILWSPTAIGKIISILSVAGICCLSFAVCCLSFADIGQSSFLPTRGPTHVTACRPAKCTHTHPCTPKCPHAHIPPTCTYRQHTARSRTTFSNMELYC